MPAAAGADVTTFSYTGGEQTYTVPAGVHSLSITAIGAAGGTDILSGQTYSGGRGAIVTGVVDVDPGELLYVEVGGIGTNPAGGFNGGGNGAVGGGASWVGGGGASDVRTLPMSAAAISLTSRLIVAGGGGGAVGGDAGQPGGNFPVGGGAGTQTSGGAGGCPPSNLGCGGAGTLGQGGDGGTSGTFPDERYGGGGGGGLYGGGGGGGNLTGVGGGGGGSSLVPSDLGTKQLASLSTAPMVGITPVPPPTCQNVTSSTPYGLPVIVQLTCTEFAGRSLTYTIVGAPAHGRLSGLKAGGQVTVTYTPDAGFVGTDSFTYDASSTNGTSTAASVSITSTPRSVAGAGHARRSATGAKLPITCTAQPAAAARACDVTATMTVTQGSRVLRVGRATVVIRAGHTQIVAMSLNGRAKHLLAARGKLAVSIAVTQNVSGDDVAVAHQRLTL